MNQFLTHRAGVKHTSLGRGKNAAPYSFGIPFCREILKSDSAYAVVPRMGSEDLQIQNRSL